MNRVAPPVLLLLLCLSGCRPDTPRPGSAILISIDTLRADHLGVYGYAPPTSPAIDAFAEQAVVFEQAIAPSASTLTAHASIFTSRVPERHGAFFARSSPLGEDRVTLAEVLRGYGHRTAAFHGGGKLAPEWGFDQGFERYERATPRFADTVERACRWLGDVGDEPFFLFLHSYEVHHPYAPEPELLALFDDPAYQGPLPDRIGIEGELRPLNEASTLRNEPIDPADLAHVIASYDAGIRSMDAAFGELLGCLSSRGLRDETIIVFTSDHGEEFGEHGMVGWHGHTLFDELLRVPLIIERPGEAATGRRVPAPVRSIDIAPTLLAALGLPVPGAFEGRDLTALIEGRETEVDPPAAISQRDLMPRYPQAFTVRTNEWKLFGQQLYHLSEDAAEQRDVAAEHPEVVAALRLIHKRAGRADRADAPAVGNAQPTEETERELRALGYID